MLILLIAVAAGLAVGASHPKKIKHFGHKVGCAVTFSKCDPKPVAVDDANVVDGKFPE